MKSLDCILFHFKGLSFLALCLLFFLPSISKAKTSPLNIDQLEKSSAPWEIKANRILVHNKEKMTEAWGRVLLTQEENTLEAEYARYYWEKRKVFLKGNVKANWEGDLIFAQNATLNLQKKSGTLKNGILFWKEPHLYFKGKTLQKTGAKTYEFNQTKVTSCDGETPAWSLKSSSGEVTIKGYAKLKNPRLQVKDFPVLFSPYLVVPVKRKRQSGFLFPELNTGSRTGTGFNLPYYQVINDEQDLTLFTNYMSERGVMLGAEYRFLPNMQTKGVLRFDWMRDDRSPETEAEEYGQFSYDGLTRSNKDRFWLRGKINSYFLNPKWDLKLDLDLVSDQNYLREFDSGYSGFETNRNNFLDQFSRDIEDKDDLTRTSAFNLRRSWEKIGTEITLEYQQNLKYINDNLDSDLNPSVQKLPQIDLDFYKTSFMNTGLDWEAQNSLTYFWREAGSTGARIDLHPQFSKTLQSKGLTLIPKLGWRETIYGLNDLNEDPYAEDHFETRGMPDISLSAQSSLFKVFNLSQGKRLEPKAENFGQSYWSKLMHKVDPELSYEYIPDTDQNDLPEFDDLDRIEQENLLTFSLDNVLSACVRQVGAIQSENSTEYELQKRYFDFLRLEIEQPYDIDEARRDRRRDEYPKRPFLDLRSELTLNFAAWTNLQSTTWYSHYLGKVTEHEHILNYRLYNLFHGYFGYDYQRELENDIHRKGQDEQSILRAGGVLNAGKSWKFYLNYENDLERSELIERSVGVKYQHQCWSVQVGYEDSADEKKFAILISFKSLGEFGQDIGFGLE